MAVLSGSRSALRISLRMCFRLYPLLVRLVWSSLVRSLKVMSLEQIHRGSNIRLLGMDCLLCLGVCGGAEELLVRI